MENIEIKVGKKTIKVRPPQSWDDLDDRTALLFFNMLFEGKGNDFTVAAWTAVKLISMTQHLLGLPADLMAMWEAERIAKDAENGQAAFLDELKQVMSVALAGLFDIGHDEETGATTYSVRFNRTRNIWPALTHTPKARGKAKPKTTWYYAPASGLANITIYELAFAFSMYEGYLQTGDEVFADKLIGALYRPSRPETKEERESAWHGDRRQPLRGYEGKVDERAKMAHSLPALTRRFLVFWFAGCRETIAKQYPRVFRKEKNGNGGASDWGKLLLSLAETGTFGPLGETSDQHFSNALAYMTMKDEQAEAARREMERMKRR